LWLSNIPSVTLCQIKAAKQLVGWETIGPKEGHGVYAALASSIDYYAPPHTDDDYFLSLHLVDTKTETGEYKFDMEIAHFFCFPELDYAVALRPGDELIFYPLVEHCFVEREESYEDTAVHVITCHLKTSNVGLNDNNIPLTPD
jgi:hypothetical protein